MRAYEVLFILKPDLEEEAINAAIEKFSNLIQQTAERLNRSTAGAKKLAYEIQDFREGYYTLVLFQCEPETAKELDRVMKLADEVLRHLIVRRDAA